MERVMQKCRKCGRETPEEVLKSNWWICPGCGGYFRMSARERIRLTIDEGSFRELDPAMIGGNPLDFPEYDAKLDGAREKSGERDAVVTGYGRINKRKCAFFVMDSGFMMGSMGTVVGEKITRVFEYAVENRLPVIGFTCSGGERMQDFACELIKRGFCVAIGTDAHSSISRNNRILDKIDEFPEEITQEETEEQLNANPLRILKKEDLPEKEVEYF